MIKQYSLLPVFLLLLLVSGACVTDDDSPAPDDQVTSVEIVLRQPPATQLTFRWVDNDGPDGTPAAFDIIELPPNSEYTYELRLLDLSDVQSQIDRTSEIRFLSNDYLACILTTGNTIEEVTITDTDDNGDPLGLAGTLTTGPAGNSQIRVVVRRDTDKSVSSRCGLGDLIVDAVLPVVVE